MYIKLGLHKAQCIQISDGLVTICSQVGERVLMSVSKKVNS